MNEAHSIHEQGSYQPSHELMLRFYAYFKQATEGQCVAPRPAFWEVVKKMKWEAWNKLGNMSREEAMNNYVEELKKIVETMSYTDNVATFLGSLGSFYDSVPVEDLELLVGNVIERIRSQPGSPLGGSPLVSRESSPNRTSAISAANGRITSSLETSPASSYSASPLPPNPDDDEEEEEFIDTVETEPERIVKENSTVGRSLSGSKKPNYYSNGVPMIPKNDSTEIIPNGHINGVAIKNHVNGHHSHIAEDAVPPAMDGLGEEGGRETVNSRGRSRERHSPRVHRAFPVPTRISQTELQIAMVKCCPNSAVMTPPRLSESLPVNDISDQIREAVLHLQRDLDRVTARVRSLEVSALSGSLHNSSVWSNERHPSWWPFPDLSPRTFMFVILWPLFVHAVILWLRKRRSARAQLL
ncbi:Acyl-CoA-binding domain-containing protein 5 [Zootermopsis nevadensis]|uniref:Acyl-CoA-binding domain-containing protein 5 n=1 Tax=Zootermopsis nevadensis TaxID=136037 RepID=A0A067QRY5_ZOONE|nr:Acyl-CoA-binding domain-containing protein 5 [Zootermopsis nevadensis]